VPPPRLWLVLLAACLPPATRGDEPLRPVIDREVRAAWKEQKIEPAPKSSDAEFLRRVSIDLVGSPPTHDEAAPVPRRRRPEEARGADRPPARRPPLRARPGAAWDLTLFGRRPATPPTPASAPRSGPGSPSSSPTAYRTTVGPATPARRAAGSEMFLVSSATRPRRRRSRSAASSSARSCSAPACHDHPSTTGRRKTSTAWPASSCGSSVREVGAATPGRRDRRGGSGEVLFSAAQGPGPGERATRSSRSSSAARTGRAAPAKDSKEPPPPKGGPCPAGVLAQGQARRLGRRARQPVLRAGRGQPGLGQFMGRGLVPPDRRLPERERASHPALLKALSDGSRPATTT
jgi:hypothetical protein